MGYKAKEDNVCIHKNGYYLKHINGLKEAKEYVYDRLNVESEESSGAITGCRVLTITGTRK